MIIRKVISGGQSGCDRAGLEAAREMNVPTGGFAPLGWRTENGSDSSLAGFGLIQHSDRHYYGRTRANVEHSDGTVVFGKPSSGSNMTEQLCITLSKPHIMNPTFVEMMRWILEQKISTLNVAGNRESVNPGIYMQTKLFLCRIFYIMGPSVENIERRELVKDLYRHGYRWDTYKIANNAERPIEVAPENVLRRIVEDLKKRHWDG